MNPGPIDATFSITPAQAGRTTPLVFASPHSGGLYPDDILFAARDFVIDLWNKGFKTLGKLGDYLLLGAVIVIPVFVLIRLLSYRR